MHWWYERDGKRGGPVTEMDLLALFARGDFKATTLVWRDGFSQWTRFCDVPSLAAQIPAMPPPLPPSLPTAASVAQAVPLIQVAAMNIGTPEDLSRSNPSVTSEVTSPATWYRYFARQIDICLISFPVVFLGFVAIGMIASPAFTFKLQAPGMASAIAFLVLWLLAPLAEAISASAFGNTPGKALFNLKVQSLEGRGLTFAEQIKRAYRAMLYGLGLFLPFISLFTCISQFNQVKKNGSAGYDAGLFRVHERNLTGPRKFIAVSIWILSFFALMGLNFYDKYDNARIAAPKSWTNPATSAVTTIPGGWDTSSETNAQGQAIHIFTHAADAIQVVFASEDVPQDATLDAYILAFVRGVKPAMTVSPDGDGAIVAGHSASLHQGELLSPKAPIEVTFVKRGKTVWRTVAILQGGTPASPSLDALRAAVFLTVPKQ